MQERPTLNETQLAALLTLDAWHAKHVLEYRDTFFAGKPSSYEDLQVADKKEAQAFIVLDDAFEHYTKGVMTEEIAELLLDYAAVQASWFFYQYTKGSFFERDYLEVALRVVAENGSEKAGRLRESLDQVVPGIPWTADPWPPMVDLVQILEDTA